MVKICGKPFLEYQIEFLKKNKITDIVLCVGYKASKIIEHFGNGDGFGVRIRYSAEKNGLLGTAGAIKNALPLLENNFFVIYGDSYLQMDFKKFAGFFLEKNAVAAMSVLKNNDRFDKSNVSVKDGLVTEYKKSSGKKFAYIDYGALLLSKRIITPVPADKVVNLDGILERLIEKKKLHAFVVKKRFYEIGSHEGLREFRKYVSNQ